MIFITDTIRTIFLVDWSNKTTSGKHYLIIGTDIINKILFDILNFSHGLIKKITSLLLDLNDLAN